jgi:hypothetical protein
MRIATYLGAAVCTLAVVIPARALAAVPGEVVLTREGQPAAVLVLAANPTRAAQLAAAEVQHHVRLISGALLPLVKEGAPVAGTAIFVGATEAAKAAGLAGDSFKPQEYAVQFSAAGIFLVGRDAPEPGEFAYDMQDPAACTGLPGFWEERGTLDAAYDFLEQGCGVRWLNPTDLGTVVPQAATLKVKGSDIRRQPGFEFRDAIGAMGENVALYDSYVALWPRESTGYKQWDALAYADLHLRFPDPGRYEAARGVLARLFLLRRRNGGTIQRCNHSLYGYYERYWKDPATRRPEMFAKGYEGEPPQMCYTSRALIEQQAQDARDYYDGKKTGRELGIFWQPQLPNWFPVEPMDNSSFCTCAQCEALLQRDENAGRFYSTGVFSDYFFTFINAVAQELRKTHPDRSVVTLAYASHAALPKTVKLDPSVAVQFCFACNRAPYDREQYEHEMSLLKAWAAADPGRPLYLWLYDTFPVETARNGGQNCFPGFFAHTIGTQMKEFHRLGVRGMFHCGYGQEVEAYVTFKLMDDPTLAVDTLLASYFAGLYGAAAAPMQQLYLDIEKTYSDPALRPAPGEAPFIEVNWKHLGSPERMAALEALLGQAKALATTEREKRNVALFEVGVWSYMLAGRQQYQQMLATPVLKLAVPRCASAGGDPAKAAWDQAAPLTPPWCKTASSDPTDRQLSGRIAHDGEYLYLEVVDQCETAKLQNSAMVFPYDDWEVFVAAQRGLPYRQYAANPMGVTTALSHGEVNFRRNVAMDRHSMKVACDTTAADRWVTRFRWRLSDIILGGVKPGGTFYLNVVRVTSPGLRGAADTTGIAAWVPFTRVHEVTRLAELKLAP